MIKTINIKLKAFAESKWFFRTALLLFIIEASWVAITSRYPMAFDESYHFGLIQFFSHHLNPIITSQPSSTYNLGAIIHNPSFLYHYLMSFPYRFISLITPDLKTQIISLRFINIAMMVTTLIFMKRILRQLSLPKSLSNIVLLVFALTPLVTVLSVQINYDNLLVLASTIAVYELLLFSASTKKGKVDLVRLASLICLCIYASFVKFAFLAMFLGIVIVATWQLTSLARSNKEKLIKQVKHSYLSVPVGTKVILLSLFVLGTGLFVKYYGYNVVSYRNLVPQCNQVLTIGDCKHYYAWNRNYTIATYDRTHHVKRTMNVFSYTVFWFKVEYYQLFGEIIPTGGLVYIETVFYLVVMTLSVIGAVCAALTLKQIFKRFKLTSIIFVIAVTYLTVLWLRNYHDYLVLGRPLAIQGRYLVSVLLYIYAIFGLGVTIVLESKRILQFVMRPLIALIVVASFVYFGGYVRYASQISPKDGWPKVAQKPKTYSSHSIAEVRKLKTT